MSEVHLNFMDVYFTGKARVLNGLDVNRWLPEQFGSYANVTSAISTRELNLALDTVLKADNSGNTKSSDEAIKAQLEVNHGAAIKRAINTVYGQRPLHSNSKMKHDDFMRSADYGNRVTLGALNQQRTSIGIEL